MTDPLWYKDVIVYEVHVRTFYDSNADGIGDFPGLIEKLPYLQDLGINCLWLLPFYPSPLRDDGYDIADYTSINPIYGTIDDFRRFSDEAHARGIRVLTELVVNHTSDQHPWFQRARRAPKGSPERDYYVWSDTDHRYPETRIIFTDTETSNWTWDPVAGQYYWHRFFHHQPDLNLDNPEVLQAVVDVMKFWFRLGVDGMRLDAIPYLIEREGTINENLPETHAVLKRIRRELDAEFEARVMLAEANQWPADVRAYFGDGDECHMAFHFPLMPRMFMAVRQEERHPIVEIMNQTPEIPETCQWAIFLRNHDELTLEMVTDEERDYMYAQYAADPQMRVNVGIRRRLAPLMENNPRRIELMNSLLFTMPGTPIIYYGDEIGMGDNVYLGDRNGVRTPMQWSGDRNAGFSRADPARLFAPVILDPVYTYEAINVEAQERSPFSLLHWMKRMIALRRQHQVFGRGAIEFLPAANRKVLAYVRRYHDDVVLCVANLARTVQPVELPLQAFAGLTPVEMMGQTEFPAIGEGPYFLTLAPYGFYGFQLQEVQTPDGVRGVSPLDEHAPVPALFAGVVWDLLLDGSMRTIVERQALVPYLERQRWFRAKARPVAAARFTDWATLRRGAHPAFLTVVEVVFRDGGRERYVLPLAMSGDQDAADVGQHTPHVVLARITGARKGLLYDGLYDDWTCAMLLAAMQEGRDLAMQVGRLRARPVGAADPPVPADALAPIARPSAEQSNTSVRFGTAAIMKVFRRVDPGINPDVEIGEFLAHRAGARVPALLGTIDYVHDDGAEPASMAMLQELIKNQGNGWEVTIEALGRYFDRVTTLPAVPVVAVEPRAWVHGDVDDPPDEVVEAIGTYLAMARVLGRRTGELHVELAGSSTPAFVPESYSAAELEETAAVMREHALAQVRLLEQTIGRLSGRNQELAHKVLRHRSELLERFDRLRQVRDGARRIRCHGDYHLGQVLVTAGDIVILDFEGEPARPLAERRRKTSPLRDVAGMLRSFSYAAATGPAASALTRPEDLDRIAPWVDLWEIWVSAVFLRAYVTATEEGGLRPADARDLHTMLQAFVFDKAAYELGYELNNRPDWVHIPLAGLLRLR